MHLFNYRSQKMSKYMYDKNISNQLTHCLERQSGIFFVKYSSFSLPVNLF